MSVRQTNESVVGLYVVAKFYLSKAPNGTFQFISRTLGKLGLVSRQFKGELSNDQEMWLCQITKEIMPRASNGAFVLMPIKKVDPLSVKKIIPGFYNYEKVGSIAVVRPNDRPSDYWILSKITRQVFANKHRAVVVPIDYKEETNAAVSSQEPEIRECVPGTEEQQVALPGCADE